MLTSTVSIFGLGKLGAGMAAGIASKGFKVIGVDVDPVAVKLINSGHAPVQEPGLEQLLAAQQDRLTATTDAREAILNSDLTFIVVPTPSDAEGGFSLSFVEQAAFNIGQALKEKPGYHLVALTSTVLPGSTQFRVLPVLEQESGKVCGRDFGLCYNPEFIALGTVIRDFLNPDFVLIGESDEPAGSQLEAFYQRICENNPPVARMNFVNAELTKIAVNTFVTTKITFANMIAEICNQLPKADVDVVTSALGLDRRIGQRYLKGGLGYGGPCFPRDNLALSYIARQLGCHPLIAESTDQLNRAYGEILVELVLSHCYPGDTVAVLGLAYKPGSEVVEESQGLYFAARLVQEGHRVTVFDPLAMKTARRELNNSVTYAGSLETCLSEADVVVVANPDPAFDAIQASNLRNGKTPVVVVDCWRMLKGRFDNNASVQYIGFGLGNPDPRLAGRLTRIWNRKAGDLLGV